MRILVTAGNTLTPIDQVRCITNIFSGRTGGKIALEAHRRGHVVHLLTSHPEAIDGPPPSEPTWSLQVYRTFDDLHEAMAALIPTGGFDVIVHCAAVSDYAVSGVYAPAARTNFDAGNASWRAEDGLPRMTDIARGKIKSSHPEAWLRLVRTPKLVDKIRSEWSFRGYLVKFKLEVGVEETELCKIADDSRLQSDADFMVANTLDGMRSCAYLGPLEGEYRRVPRKELAERLVDAIEARSAKQ